CDLIAKNLMEEEFRKSKRYCKCIIEFL
ncbi:hypothetical protein LCGC14_2804210, partial [marine sediment metagenome]